MTIKATNFGTVIFSVQFLHWSVITTIVYERSYKWNKGQSYHQWEKHVIYVLTPEQKITKNIPVIIKQLENIINTNNSFLRARADYAKETYRETL